MMEKNLTVFYLEHNNSACHTARILMDNLCRQFPGKQISRFGGIEWPARLPLLTPHDYCLWDYLKNKVHWNTSRTIKKVMVYRIKEMNSIYSDIQQKVMVSTASRLQNSFVVNGGHLKSRMFKSKTLKEILNS